MKNPFKSEPPTPPTPDPTIPLQNQIEDLQRKQHILHAKIMSERNLIEKPKLISQEAKLLQKINNLRRQKLPHEEVKASQQIDALFKEKLYVLELNEHRTKPTKDLMITLKFYPCGHKKTIHIKDLIHPKPRSEQSLLSHWKGIFSANTILTGSFNCQECRKAKQKKRREEHRYSDADRIGTVRFMLKVI